MSSTESKPTPDPESAMEPDSSGKFKGQNIGIDIDKLEAYVGSLHWKIRKDAHTKTIVDKLRLVQKEYETEFKKLLDDPNAITWDKEVEYEKATREIGEGK